MNKKEAIQHSFRHAFDGLSHFFKFERNSIVHLIISVLVIILGFLLKISLVEWGLIIITIALVLGSELLNTAVEKACDKIQPEFDPSIKVIKDLAAGSVLIFAIASIILGILIFLPPLIRFIGNWFFYR